MRIFLVGFMGSGKSRVGYKLSKLMKHRFVDTDKLVASLHGMSVAEIFEKNGEEYFRAEETKALNAICKMENIVVATGGGLPCFNDNMKTMNENGLTIYFQAQAGLLMHRLLKNRAKRPLIANLNENELLEYIVQKLHERKPFYTQAQLTYKAENLDIFALRKKIEEITSA